MLETVIFFRGVVSRSSSSSGGGEKEYMSG
jgi:hypothetical protein